ncbi:MAG: hypothetical protein ACOH1Y_10830 [Propionicimonas sp.]
MATERAIVSKPGLARRSFLRRVGIGAATAFVIADAGFAYRAYDQGVFSDGRGPAFDPLLRWPHLSGTEAIVGSAILAANAHNSQPWAFGIRSDRIEVYADRARSTGANDPLLRELDVSLGCALENMVLAARANGFAPHVSFDPRSGSDLVATIHLVAGPLVRDRLYEAIPSRRSNRSEYTSGPVAGGSLAAMGSLADDTVAPARLHWLTGDEQRRGFADLLVEATRAHNADEAQSQDSFSWWRSSWDDVQSRRDGLNIDGVGLPPVIRTLGKILPPTERASADATFLDRTRVQATSAAAFGLILVDEPGILRDRLVGGRLLQRAHLWASANGLGFQHMNQITERIDRDHQLGRTSPFEAPLEALAGSPRVLGAFRVGTPTIASLPSPRRSIQEVSR